MDLKGKTIHFYILPVFYLAISLVVVSEANDPWSAFGVFSSILAAIAAVSAAYVAYRSHQLNKLESIDKRIRLLSELARETWGMYFSILSYEQWNKISRETLDSLNELAKRLEDNEHLLPVSTEVENILQKYILFQNCGHRANSLDDDYIRTLKIAELHEADLVRWFYENRGAFAQNFSVVSEQLKQEVLALKQSARMSSKP